MRATSHRRLCFDKARTEHCRVGPSESDANHEPSRSSDCDANHELREGRTKVSARRSRANVYKLAQPPDGPLVACPFCRDRECITRDRSTLITLSKSLRTFSLCCQTQFLRRQPGNRSCAMRKYAPHLRGSQP